MSLSADLPASALETVISFLLPLILPALGDDLPAARHLALHMLEEYNSKSVRELRLAGEAIGFSLKSLAVLARSAESGLPREALDMDLKWACSLNRSSHQAQRRLAELQRAERTAPAAEPAGITPQIVPSADVTPASHAPGTAASIDPVSITAQPGTTPDEAAAAARIAPPGTALSDEQVAEAALARATKLLNLMKAHHKGGPPPHSQAAQQIQAQQRVVETARMKQEQARKRHAAAPDPQPGSAGLAELLVKPVQNSMVEA